MDVGLTCICYLRSIILDSIFYDSMGLELSHCFLRGGNRCLPQFRTNGYSLIAITPMGVRKT